MKRQRDDAREVLRLLSAHVRGIMFELDSEARFVHIWASDPQLLALPTDKLLGCTLLETLGPELGKIHHDAVRATLDSGQSARYEYELDVGSGHCYFACESVAVSGKRVGQRHAVFWIRDVTEQALFRKQLLEGERLASVATIAAGLAHEINNPLAYMLLNSQQLRGSLRRMAANAHLKEPMAPLCDSVEMILDGIQHVQRIIGELRELASPPGHVEPVDIQQVIDLSVELTRSLWEGRARLTADCQSVPPVLAQRRCLVQVFTNLITNAAEAIVPSAPSENEIAISVRQNSANKVQVEIRDSGAGIAPEDTQRVFEPFFTTKEHGTGLGLPLCHMIVRALEGEITLDASLARGSAFKVLLPAATS